MLTFPYKSFCLPVACFGRGICGMRDDTVCVGKSWSALVNMDMMIEHKYVFGHVLAPHPQILMGFTDFFFLPRQFLVFQWPIHMYTQ